MSRGKRWDWARTNYRGSKTGKKIINQAFWNELNKLDLMTAEEERESGCRIQSAVRRILSVASGAPIPARAFGRTLKKKIIPLLSKEEHKMLFEMVTRNLRMAVAIAQRFDYNFIDFQDLVAFGIEGLIEAALRFDPDHVHEGKSGGKFSTYAAWWVRQSINRAVHDFGSTVRMPVYMFENRRKIAQAGAKATNKLGRAPTVSELAGFMKITERELLDIMSRTVSLYSLNVKIESHENNAKAELQDIIPFESSSNPEDETRINLDFRKLKRVMMKVLTPMEQVVLELRSQELSLEECSCHPEVTRLTRKKKSSSKQWVQQIQDRALRKLRIFFKVPEPKERLYAFDLRERGRLLH